MKKLLLMGMILATVIAPMMLSRDARPMRGYRRLRWTMLVATVLWGVLLRFLYFKLS